MGTVLLYSKLIKDPKLATASTSEFLLLGNCSIESSSNSYCSFLTLLRSTNIFMSFIAYSLLIRLTTSWESLRTLILDTTRDRANFNPTINASYSASLFVAQNLNHNDCSITVSCGVLSIILVPLP